MSSYPSAYPSSSSAYPSSASDAQALNPTTRSRTLLFLSYRDSTARSSTSRSRRRGRIRRYEDEDEPGADEEDEQRGLIGHADGGRHFALDVDDLPPKWVDVAEKVEEVLAGTQAKMNALDKLHAKHVLPGFSDRSAEEREIEQATTAITRDFRACQALIQTIQPSPQSQHRFPPSTSDPSPSNHERLAAKNVQRGLAAKVQALSATFRKRQRVYLDKLQGHAIKNQDLLIASGAISLKGSEGLSALDEDVAVASQTQAHDPTQTQAQAQAQAGPDWRSRNRELDEIARSIASLAELFKDLGALVIDQGTLLDSVEYNIEQTAVNVQEAAKELDVAQKYQKNTGRRKCIFLLLLCIFGLIVVLIFKPRRHRSSPPPPIPSPSALPTLASPLVVLASRAADVVMPP